MSLNNQQQKGRNKYMFFGDQRTEIFCMQTVKCNLKNVLSFEILDQQIVYKYLNPTKTSSMENTVRPIVSLTKNIDINSIQNKTMQEQEH